MSYLCCAVVAMKLLLEIYGGPGRARTFDLPIMSLGSRVVNPAQAALCRRLMGVAIPFSLPLVCSGFVFTRICLGDSVQLLPVTSSPY